MGAITVDTVETWLVKTRAGLEKVLFEKQSMEERIETLFHQTIAITAQIETLESLLDFDNPQVVGLPHGEDLIEELHENRLDGPEGLEYDEVKEARQDVYFREAVEAADDIDGINTKELPAGEDAESDT
jgi:hypothetical protein